MILYYGNKISDNITKTPEGYLICHNVKIGRIGPMEYYGHELPKELNIPPEKKVKVYRTHDELFSKATIASFEGKPITNEHPTQNLDVNTVSLISRGHTQNIRPEGDFLVGDLFITDMGLIAEVENGKREVSSGYLAAWVPMENGTIEQQNIVGNHVAVVQSGRAGPRVAIQDSMPEEIKNKNPERSRKPMSKNVSKKILTALGFKHFVQDAEPEEIAKAMDAMNEGEETEAPPVQQKEDGALEQILTAIKGIDERLTKLEQSDKQVHQEVGADAEFAGLEKEMETKDEEGAASGVVEPEKGMDEDPDAEEEKKAPAADSMKKFVQDMKPVIMAIPDEKARLAAAKQFTSLVRDARTQGINGYSAIVETIASKKKEAMDSKQQTPISVETRNQQACEAWNKQNVHYKGGN